jgi:hypothetical protein
MHNALNQVAILPDMTRSMLRSRAAKTLLARNAFATTRSPDT